MDDPLRLGVGEAITEQVRNTKVNALKDAADTAEFALDAIVGLMGPGGTLVIAQKDLEKGNKVAAGLGLLSLIPIGIIIKMGIGRIAIQAADDGVVEITAQALKAVPEGQAAELPEHVVKELAGKNSAEVVAVLEKYKLLHLPPIAIGTKARDLLKAALGNNPFPVAAEAHHIFGVNFFETPLGRKLRAWGVDLNGQANGVLLPKYDYPGRKATLHNGRPTRAYGEEVYRYLDKATKS